MRALARIPRDGRWVLIQGDLARQLLPVLSEHRAGVAERPCPPEGNLPPPKPGEENYGRSEIEGRPLLWRSRRGEHFTSVWVCEERKKR